MIAQAALKLFVSRMSICVSRQIGRCHIITGKSFAPLVSGALIFYHPSFLTILLNYFGKDPLLRGQDRKEGSPHAARSEGVPASVISLFTRCRRPFVATLKTSVPASIGFGELLRGASNDN